MIHELYSRLIGLSHMGWYKALVSLVIATFVPISYAIMILYLLMGFDLFLGIWKGIAFQSFSSHRLRLGVSKIVLYSISFIVVRLIEQQLHLPNTLLADTLIIFLSATEVISIIETLVLLGVPIPSQKIIKFITDNIKIDGVRFSKDQEINNAVEEIHKIQVFHVPAILDRATKEMVGMKIRGLEEVIKQVNTMKTHGEKPQDMALKVKLSLTSEMKLVERELRSVRVDPKRVTGFINWCKFYDKGLFEYISDISGKCGKCDKVGECEECIGEIKRGIIKEIANKINALVTEAIENKEEA